MTQNTANKKAFDEAYFNKLKIRSYRKKVQKLSDCINKLAALHFKGMSVFDAQNPSLEAQPHVSTYNYAEKRGIDSKMLSSLLESEGVITRVLGNTYVVDSLAHSKHCFYKKFPLYGNKVRHCLYWNAEGVQFLNDFVKDHALVAKREFSF